MRRDAAPIRHISIPYLRINILCADFLQPRLPYQCMSSLSGRKRRITLRPFSLSFSLPLGPLLETSTDSPAAVFTPPPIFRRAPGVHIQYIAPLTEIPIPPAGNAVCGAGPFRRAFSPGPDGSA